jgi:hypothetical protein
VRHRERLDAVSRPGLGHRVRYPATAPASTTTSSTPLWPARLRREVGTEGSGDGPEGHGNGPRSSDRHRGRIPGTNRRPERFLEPQGAVREGVSLNRSQHLYSRIVGIPCRSNSAAVCVSICPWVCSALRRQYDDKPGPYDGRVPLTPQEAGAGRTPRWWTYVTPGSTGRRPRQDGAGWRRTRRPPTGPGAAATTAACGGTKLTESIGSPHTAIMGKRCLH